MSRINRGCVGRSFCGFTSWTRNSAFLAYIVITFVSSTVAAGPARSVTTFTVPMARATSSQDITIVIMNGVAALVITILVSSVTVVIVVTTVSIIRDLGALVIIVAIVALVISTWVWWFGSGSYWTSGWWWATTVRALVIVTAVSNTEAFVVVTMGIISLFTLPITLSLASRANCIAIIIDLCITALLAPHLLYFVATISILVAVSIIGHC